eukprot:m.27861 g.27861  ORF g.27861 m.27861 type:complete len:134 (+) comp5990_c1_seq1:118-519(+)
MGDESWMMLKATECAVAGVASMVGYKSVEDMATMQLASVASAFIRQIGLNTLKHANDEGRNEVNGNDFEMALEDVSISVQQVEDFIFNVSRGVELNRQKRTFYNQTHHHDENRHNENNNNDGVVGDTVAEEDV